MKSAIYMTSVKPKEAMPAEQGEAATRHHARVDLSLVFDFSSIISSAPYPIIRRYTKHLVSTAADRSVALGSAYPGESMWKLSNLFLDIIHFSKAMGRVPPLQRLEAGEIRRTQYLREARREFDEFMVAMTNPDHAAVMKTARSKSEMEGLRKRLSILLTCPGLAQCLTSLVDPENYLCILEKAPLRKNVLNLLHFLRHKSHQEIKLGIITNNWEVEGAYAANQQAVERTGCPLFIPVKCPIEYVEKGEMFQGAAFDVSSLFDVIVQSHMSKKRKPHPVPYFQALESLTGAELVGSDAKKIHEEMSGKQVYLFENRQQNIEGAQALVGQPFTHVFRIDNGPDEVFAAVMDTLKRAGEVDPRWAKIREQAMEVVGPLFKTSQTSWVQLEVSNEDGNLLSTQHPMDGALLPGDCGLTTEEKTALLTHLWHQLPHYFPLYGSVKESHVDANGIKGAVAPPVLHPLWEEPGLATSGGPIVFERFHHAVLPNAYRISLRTGSFIVRIEPKKENLTVEQALRTIGRREDSVSSSLERVYLLSRHLMEKTNIPVPRCLLYTTDGETPLGRCFLVSRFVEGRIVRRIGDIIRQNFSRPFSRRRILTQQTLRPRLFIDSSVDLLIKLHQCPIPAFLQQRADELSKTPAHPVTLLLDEWDGNLKAAREHHRKKGYEVFNCKATTYLCDLIRMRLIHDDSSPPLPRRYCLVHSNFHLGNLLFSHRSLEGRPKYPPRVKQLLSFQASDVGDPLLDLARLTLILHLPAPLGVGGLGESSKQLFPSTFDVVSSYAMRLQEANELPNMDTLMQAMRVYQAAACFKMAAVMLFNLHFQTMEVKPQGPAFIQRRQEAAEHISKLGAALLKGEGLEALDETLEAAEDTRILLSKL